MNFEQGLFYHNFASHKWEGMDLGFWFQVIMHMGHVMLITHNKVWLRSHQSFNGDRVATVFNQQWRSTLPKITVTDTVGVTNLPHYKNSRPDNLGGSEEKIGVFIAKAIFAFPSGFIFRMIRPLNLEELDSLVVGLTLRLVENAARMFSIS